jgi:hypothetical protein
MGYMAVFGGWIDVHGAGAQRSEPKIGDPGDYPTGFGPQGDAIRIYNYVRLVRNADPVTRLSDIKQEEKYKPFPNPANNIIQFNGTDIRAVRFYDSVGNLMLHSAVSETNPSVNIRTLRDGVYVMKCVSDKSDAFAGKLIVRR